MLGWWREVHCRCATAARPGATFDRTVLGLQDADDSSIHRYAGKTSSIVITKDSDFVELVHRHGIPPQVVWVTCGNTTNASLKRIFDATFANAMQLLMAGETIVEIADAG